MLVFDLCDVDGLACEGAMVVVGEGRAGGMCAIATGGAGAILETWAES